MAPLSSLVRGKRTCHTRRLRCVNATAELPMSGLLSYLDELDSVDLSAIDDRRLLNGILEMVAGKEGLDARILRWLGEAERRDSVKDDGYVSTASWLRDRARVSSRSAHQDVGMARALDGMTIAARAHREGAFGSAHLRILAKAARDHPEAYQEAEAALVDAARTASLRELRRLVDYWTQNLDPDAAVDAAEALHDRRRVHISSTFQGMVRLDGWLDREGGATVIAALGAHADRAARDPEDGRSPAQARADAFVEICRDHLDHGRLPVTGGERPHLNVTVDLGVLEQRAGKPCEANEVGVITPDAALRLACDAGVTRIITRGPSEPLGVGRRTRTISPAQRRALDLRDGGCRYPGCDRPQRWCDGHHIRHWIHGGPTDLDNLVLLCRRHHRRVHEEGETIALDGPEVRVGRGPPAAA